MTEASASTLMNCSYRGPVIRIGSKEKRAGARILYGFYQNQAVWLEFQSGGKNQTKIYLNDGDEFNETEKVEEKTDFKICEWFVKSMSAVYEVGLSNSRGKAGQRKVVAIYFLVAFFRHLGEEGQKDLLLDVANKAGFVKKSSPQYQELVPDYRPRLLPYKPPAEGIALRKSQRRDGAELPPSEPPSQNTIDSPPSEPLSAFDVLWKFTVPTLNECPSIVANSTEIVSDWLGKKVTTAALTKARIDLPFDSKYLDMPWAVGWWSHESIDCMDLGNIISTKKRDQFEAAYAKRQQRWKGTSDALNSGASEPPLNPAITPSTTGEIAPGTSSTTQMGTAQSAKDSGRPSTASASAQSRKSRGNPPSTMGDDPDELIVPRSKVARASYSQSSQRFTS